MAATSRQSGSPRKRYELLLEQEEFILAATELIFSLMEEAGITKAELARRVGRSRGYLTQVLDGTRNMTLRTLAELAAALGHRVCLDARPLSSRRVRSMSGAASSST